MKRVTVFAVFLIKSHLLLNSDILEYLGFFQFTRIAILSNDLYVLDVSHPLFRIFRMFNLVPVALILSCLQFLTVSKDLYLTNESTLVGLENHGGDDSSDHEIPLTLRARAMKKNRDFIVTRSDSKT